MPPDDAGAMAWHQRQRLHLLEARVALIEGDPATAASRSTWVRDDAARRGSARTVVQAEVVQHLATAMTGAADSVAVDATVASLQDLARLEAWRLTGRLAAATGRSELWAAADGYAEQLVAACGPHADRVRTWTRNELARLRA